jgi:ribulose kinase
VAQGGSDAEVAMIGLGVTTPGKLAFITGSSHLHQLTTEPVEVWPPSTRCRPGITASA